MLALAWASLALASAGEDEVESCLQTKIYEAYGEGWRARPRVVTTVKVGEPHLVPLFLYGGFEVRFLSCAAEGALNLDLLLVDSAGDVVARDTRRSREPELRVTPPRTGRYRLAIYLQAVRPSVGEGVPVAATLTFR